MDDGIYEMANALSNEEIMKAMKGVKDCFPQDFETRRGNEDAKAYDAKWMQAIKSIAIERGLISSKGI